VIGDGRVDVDHVHSRVFEQRGEVLITRLDAEVITDGIELLRIALADGVGGGVGMLLPERDEFRSESETDNGDVDFLAHVLRLVALPPEGVARHCGQP